jgi:hypothetical protein
VGVRKEGGGKARALALVLSLFLLSSFLLWQGRPAGAATYTDTADSDFAQGIHENTENVNGDLRLKSGLTSGRFTSRSFQAGANFFRWGTLSWDATLPTLFVPAEVDNVGSEPTTLADGSSRIGEVAGGSYLNTRAEDGVYENLREVNIGPSPYSYVQSEVVYRGGTSGVSGAQGDDGSYENLYETIPWYYAESAAESTTTSTTYQDKVTLTFTPEDGSTYLIIASWLMSNTSTSYQVKAKLTRTTGTAKDFNELIYQPKSTLDNISGGAIGIDSFGTSPGPQTYKIQFCTSNASGTAKIKEARIFAIKLNSLDAYAQAEDRTTTTSTSWQDKTTLTFTPPTQDDYLILAYATADGSSTSYDFKVQLTIDGTAYSTVNIRTVNSANRYPWAVSKVVNLTAASHTIKIQYCSASTSGTAGIAHARIVALNLSRFQNLYYAEDEARTTTTSTTYVDKLSLTQTPPAGDYLILGVAGLDEASTSYNAYAQMVRDTSSYGEMSIRPNSSSAQGHLYFSMKKETLSGASTTWKIQYETSSSSYAAGIKDARIAVLQLPRYRMDIQHSITGIPAADSYRLEIEYYTVGDQEPVSLYLYNFSTGSWENKGNLQVGGSAANPYLFSYGFTDTYISGGEVRARFVQADDDDTRTSLMVDYTRVWCEPDYALRWQHNLENVSTGYPSYRVQVKGYTSGDSEKVGVYIWKNSTGSWEYMGSLDATERTLTKDIPGSEISSYLSGNNLFVKYESEDNRDNTITYLHVDLCVVVEGNLYKSYVKFRVQVSSNGSTWSGEMGPDGTSSTYFTSSPASLENIPADNYIRYVAYLSSEHSQLTGAGGPLVHEVTIQSMDTGKGWIYTQDAKDVSWNSAILTARVLYSDPGVVVRFQYRRVGGSWENTPWEGCEGKIYWRRITGLENDTPYEFQAQLTYGGQIENGGIRTFRTLPSKPVATPLRVTLVDNESALLSARIYYASYDNVSIKFWYRQAGGSWSGTTAVSGYRASTYSYYLSGLSRDNNYEFKVEITYGSTSENSGTETFTTFGSKISGMGYSGDLGAGSLPGWHGVRVENLREGAKGMKLELLTSSPSPLYHSVRVVRDNGELLYVGSFLSDNGRAKVVSLRFWKTAAAGENVCVEIYDPLGFAFRGRGTDSSMPLTRSGIKYSYSYLDRTGKNVRYYDRACGLQVLEVYT